MGTARLVCEAWHGGGAGKEEKGPQLCGSWSPQHSCLPGTYDAYLSFPWLPTGNAFSPGLLQIEMQTGIAVSSDRDSKGGSSGGWYLEVGPVQLPISQWLPGRTGGTNTPFKPGTENKNLFNLVPL